MQPHERRRSTVDTTEITCCWGTCPARTSASSCSAAARPIPSNWQRTVVSGGLAYWCLGDIVEANDSHILGHTIPGGLEIAHRRKRAGIRAGDQRARRQPMLHQVACGMLATFLMETGAIFLGAGNTEDERKIKRDAVLL